MLALPILLTSASCPRANPALRLDTITLPAGFQIAVYTDKVPNARSMTLSPAGTLFVGTRNGDKVYALRDNNQDHKPDRVITVASGLDTPNGVAVRNGSLFVAERTRILRYDNIEANLDNPPEPVVVYTGFPTGGHDWKYIAFGPDDKLYVPVGAPCNVCNPEDPIFSTIMRMNPDGSSLEVFAAGVRNSVGFDWHPQTNELWFTDNGRDQMGDDVPTDELNRAPQAGLHFGFPFCHAGTVQDPQFTGRDCDEFVQPEINLGPHVAALGMRFYTGTQFPEAYRGQIFIAEHGSWNRSTPIGYRIMMVRLENGHAVEYTPFAEGWLQNRSAWGRPVDVEVMPDGALLVSDDKAGAVYRISYGG
jgi:glucose/arabinose dehydrogenase